MTLTTRILFFHLGSLAVLLAGFSTTIYFFARDYLQNQSEERLESALNTLGAAVEIHGDCVEWEANERVLRIATGPSKDQLVWVVADSTGVVVARSEQAASEDLLLDAAGKFSHPTDDTVKLHWQGARWHAGQRRIVPGGHPLELGEPAFTGADGVKFDRVVITTALPLERIRSNLRRLMWFLGGGSAGVLCVALLAGRLVCRRALRPVRMMADEARALPPSDHEGRITIPSGGDDLAKLGVALNGLLDRLHESTERQRRFTGDASHQLRTPLAGLLGQIEIALRRERTAAEYKQALIAAESNATHLLRIVESLLYLTRNDTESLVPELEMIELSPWLFEQVRSKVDDPRFNDIKLSSNEPEIRARIHPVLAGEIIQILLDNAIRYSNPGTEIRVDLLKINGIARIEISDQGIGIAEEDLTKIFQPFFRSKAALRANKSGVGLGLSIASRLAHAMGFSIIAESKADAGSRFSLEFAVNLGRFE